jgi:tRNA threonylcarbamoyladenosine biosynthesis protein TsaE
MDADSVVIPDPAAMHHFGSELAATLAPGDVLLLHGDLGAGKTTLTRGLAQGLGVPDPIQSPTFSIVAEHPAVTTTGEPVTLYHLDLYRLDDPGELEGLGYDRYLAPMDGISVIEWPERAGDWLPERFWLIQITHDDAGGRRVRRRLIDHS